ncbi:MAG: ABC transporter ATP-binding protein [Treponema sp.]|jgi:ABC-type Fe3+/spermidine/putrescine transport system ATPase subunit|nr:ABC transporter ATP-binding protein [Treponema sp.]
MGLDVVQLTKTYGDLSICLDMQVAEGETLALVGPSGCGKTTALHLIAGLIHAERGSLFSNGEDISRLPAWKRHIALVFQDLALFPHLDVGNNISYGLGIQGMARGERRARAGELLRMLKLAGYEKRRISSLSGGERQRIAIARALAVSPRALLLDEPFSSLDAPLRRQIRRDFGDLRLASKAPCIFVTHDREEAAVLGDRIALMEHGRIVESGSSRELFLFPKTESAARFFGAGQLIGCAIQGEAEEAVRVSTPLGALHVPRGTVYDPECPLLFIPRDALLLAGKEGFHPGAAHRAVKALFRKSSFEGAALTLEVEGPKQTLLRVDAGLRTEFPPRGSPLELYLDQRLLRFVRPAEKRKG